MRALRDASLRTAVHCRIMCQRQQSAAIPSVSPRPSGFPTTPKIPRISAVSRVLPDNPVYSRLCKIKCPPSKVSIDFRQLLLLMPNQENLYLSDGRGLRAPHPLPLPTRGRGAEGPCHHAGAFFFRAFNVNTAPPGGGGRQASSRKANALLRVMSEPDVRIRQPLRGRGLKGRAGVAGPQACPKPRLSSRTMREGGSSRGRSVDA